jgi:hypothetical protein
MDKKRFEDLCSQGEKADKHLKEGRTTEALKAFAGLCQDLEKKGDYDSFLAAKVTLGLLRCYVKLGDFKTAYTIWNASLEESLHGIGIYALESAQTTVKDMLSYDMICAFLHTLADSPKGEAASAVNQYLSRVCEQTTEEGDRSTMKMAVSNWKHHLREIYGASIPLELAKPLIHFEKTIGETVKPQPIDFPTGAPWEKPKDFLEMSRFTEIKNIKRPTSKKARAS